LDSIKAVLFDFGGVFTPSPFAALDVLGAQLGADPGRLMEIIFGPYHEDTDHPWHQLERGEITLVAARDAIRSVGEAQGIDCDLFQLLALMAGGEGPREAMVERTRRLVEAGYRTALVTNNAREFRESWERLIPLDELFHAVLDSSEVGMRKPAPEIFHLALERVGGVAPGEALFLDDFPANVAAATRIGMRGVLVEPDLRTALAELDALLERRP
jgi:putative hydrolase of the HAD superfamily